MPKLAQFIEDDDARIRLKETFLFYLFKSRTNEKGNMLRLNVIHRTMRRTFCLQFIKKEHVFDAKTNPNRPSMIARKKALAQDSTLGPLREIDELVLLGGGGAGQSQSRRSRQRSRVARAGGAVAQDAKIMSDHEWQSVSIADKHVFVQHMKQRLQSHPSTVSEQERRRFYETTELDPRIFENPSETVDDPDERVRLGLPTLMANFGAGSLGVSQSVYDDADAHLFDPNQAHRIESAMESTKQQFIDYIQLRRGGKPTEGIRRALAHASQDLNLATQKHLANMFRLAEQRVQETLLSERRRQLQHIARIRSMMQKKHISQEKKKQKISSKNRPGEILIGKASTKSTLSRRKRLEAKTLREVYGVDLPAAEMMWKHMAANERFLRLCEVITRMTKGVGFQHSENDEKLDEYVERLRDVYSVDASRLARVDAVQFVAAQAGVHPVDWARRWYERAMLLPLQMTPEYREVVRMATDEAESMKLETDERRNEAEKSKGQPQVAGCSSKGVMCDVTEGATSLIQKMFLNPNDPRLRATHEKRLRYIAFLHMESQIRRMRANAKLFEGVEHTTEAAECRKLMEQINEKKQHLLKQLDAQESSDVEGVWRDPEIRSLFEKIQQIAQSFIKETIAQSKLEQRAEKALRISRLLQGREVDSGVDKVAETAKAARQLRNEKRREQTMRILQLLETDIREDATWLANLQEAERPPLLQEPEAMGYIGASDVLAWKHAADKQQQNRASPFRNSNQGAFSSSLFGQSWDIPTKPVLFWGTGSAAVTQALQVAVEEAEAKRQGRSVLPPPYPTADNPWGWRLRFDPLEDAVDETSMSSSVKEAHHNQQQHF